MKTVYLSIIAISFVLVSILWQIAFAENNYNPITHRVGGFYNDTTKTELVYDGGILTINQHIGKSEYKPGEKI